MKSHKMLLIILIVFMFTLTACGKCEDKLNGKWTLKSMKMGDQEITAKELGGQTITIEFDMKTKTVKSVMGKEKEEAESFVVKECAKDKIVIADVKKEGDDEGKKEESMTIVFTGQDEIKMVNSADQGEMILVRGEGEKKEEKK